MMRYKRRVITSGLLLAALATMTACSDAGESGNTAASPDAGSPAASDAAPSAQQLDAAYLEGPWCYAHWESMGESESPNEDFVFSPNGTVLYNHAPGGPVESEGTWEVEGDILKINPKFMAFNLVIKSVESDRFIVDNIGMHDFVRGSCAFD